MALPLERKERNPSRKTPRGDWKPPHALTVKNTAGRRTTQDLRVPSRLILYSTEKLIY